MKYHDAWEKLRMQVSDAYNVANQHSQETTGEQSTRLRVRRNAYHDVLDMIEELETEGEWGE